LEGEISEIYREWKLQRNCVLTPRQFGLGIFFACFLSVIVGLAWASMGVWIILPFVFVECLGLLIAFFCYASHATDSEKVILTEDEIVVECEDAGVKILSRLPRYLVRTSLQKNKENGLVSFSWGKDRVFVGRYVNFESRQKFYGEIRGYL
tara:strand:- start:19229 stop:19681 length:453 start_codon:yes stop_codon:yes gene_type:complete